MITYEQRVKYDLQDKLNLQWAKLDRDYKARHLDYILPAGTIVQVELYKQHIGDLYLNDKVIDYHFPYDAATLLEDEA